LNITRSKDILSFSTLFLVEEGLKILELSSTGRRIKESGTNKWSKAEKKEIKTNQTN